MQPFAPNASGGYLRSVGFRTQWRGQTDTQGRRRMWRLVILSAVLHTPLMPIAALVGLLSLVGGPSSQAVPDDKPIRAIPVELISGQGLFGPGAPGAKKSPAEKPASPKPPRVKRVAHKGPSLDVGARHHAAEGDAGVDAGRPGRDAGRADAGTGRSVGDPVAMSGSAGRITNPNANVRLLIYSDRIRHNPLGPRIGQLLGAAYQWRDFFGTAGLDPIRDLDRILIVGPQLRDSSNVVAVLRYNVSRARMREALGALVARDTSRGAWLDAGVPVARASADRAERVFVMPAPHIVVVAPLSAAKSAESLRAPLHFPSPHGNEALVAYVRTPWRAFIGIRFNVPKSIRWVRLGITPTANGGAVASLLAEDASEQAARDDAEMLTRAINAVTQVNLGIVGALFGARKLSFIQPVNLQSQGKDIVGTITATRKQLDGLIEAVSAEAEAVANANARARTRPTPAPSVRARDAGLRARDASAPARDAH